MLSQTIGSPETVKKYRYELDGFMKWNGLDEYGDLLKADEKSIQRNSEDYLILLRATKSPNYVPSIVAPVELFYVMNDINLNSKRLHKMFTTRTQVAGHGVCTRENLQTMLENVKKN